MTEWTNALAREVLDLTHEDETVTVCSVPGNKAAALARAVIDLTAKLDAERFAHANTAVKVKNVEALAGRLDDGHLRYLIRNALNGGAA